jgi:ABC-2 type transport system ATP-binding protein
MLKQGQLVALDTTQNLLRMHSGCYIELRLEPDTLPEALVPLVVEHREDGAYRLALKDYVDVEGVMAQLRTAQVRVQEMEVLRPDLEEIFVQIMQKT